MDQAYTCYCGLYCENCAVKAKIDPAARALYDEMKSAGFEEIIQYIPGGDDFWPFLKDMAENGTCTSCREGSGNPGCNLRICAKEKGVEGYLILEHDNALLREKGMESWEKLQEERRAGGFVYTDGAVK